MSITQELQNATAVPLVPIKISHRLLSVYYAQLGHFKQMKALQSVPCVQQEHSSIKQMLLHATAVLSVPINKAREPQSVFSVPQGRIKTALILPCASHARQAHMKTIPGRFSVNHAGNQATPIHLVQPHASNAQSVSICLDKQPAHFAFQDHIMLMPWMFNAHRA